LDPIVGSHEYINFVLTSVLDCTMVTDLTGGCQSSDQLFINILNRFQ